MDYTENRKERARRFFPSDMDSRDFHEQNIIESYCMYYANGKEIEFIIDPVFDDELIVKYEDGTIDIFSDATKTIRGAKWLEEGMTEEAWQREFGNRLQRMIWKRRYIQSDFAELVGISQGTLSNYITGRTKPTFYMVSRMAKILKCSTDDLLVNI